MIKKLSLYLLFFLFSQIVVTVASADNETAKFRTVEESLAKAHDYTDIYKTECASKIFADALKSHSTEISQNDSETDVRMWAKKTMHSADVLRAVLQCPEIASKSDTETIIFTPVVYEFPNGRNITINYSTQPKILKHHYLLATKPSLPNGNVSPDLMDINDNAKWLNTEPAWYGIMVVQHDSLAEFVGPNKNNVLSLKYIDDNIDNIYPRGYYCTSKSAIANDSDTINKVVHEVVNIEDDSNDYYVAGDIDLGWVMYAELAGELILTLATAGTGELLMSAAKGARASRISIRLAKDANKLKRFDKVTDFIDATNKIGRQTTRVSNFEKNLVNSQKYERTLQKLEKARKSGGDVAKYQRELDSILDAARKVDPDITGDILKNADDMAKNLENSRKELTKLEKGLEETLAANKKRLPEAIKEMKEARKAADPLSVKDYDKKLKRLDELRDLVKEEKTLKKPEEIAKNNKIKQEMQTLEKNLRDYEGASSLGNYPKLRREVDAIESVDKYKDYTKELESMLKYRGELRALRRPQTGNIFTRTLKTIKATNSGAKEMTHAAKIAHGGMSSKSAKLGDWLFDTTMKHGSRLGRVYRDTGLLATGVTLVLDLYDYTSNTSTEFSNGIEFKPLCLLSADDLDGYDNVVNYGMWFMWQGNSTDPADDEAAYLQAMDFAAKFYYKLDEFQDKNGAECNVDIYVVRPIIRLDETNMDKPTGELFYLFMNDTPWTTAAQFGEQIKDIKDWERNQSALQQSDPKQKNRKFEIPPEKPDDNLSAE